MKAIEFDTRLQGNQIQLPPGHDLSDGQTVRIIILTPDESDSVVDDASAARWSQTAGAWNGAELVREDQGDQPERDELK